MSRIYRALSGCVAASFIAGCGGGGGGDTPSPASNTVPLAKAEAAQGRVVGSIVTLNGVASSDADGDALTYAWTLSSIPTGSSAVLANPASATPNFTADVAGAYTASLVVSDGKASSTAATVTVTVTAIVAKAYADNGDGTATDPSTGLTWMRCYLGETWTGTACTGAATLYSTYDVTALAGTVNFAGHSDWRVPAMRELRTIVDLSRVAPAIDTTTFPSTLATDAVLSNNDFSTGNLEHSLWCARFDSGAGDGCSSSSGLQSPRVPAYQVRLVRGEPAAALTASASDYVDHGDGTVTHTPTGLMWQRCPKGQTFNGTSCTGTAATYAWNDAATLTDNLAGHGDWRLPSAAEINLIVGYYGMPGPYLPSQFISSVYAPDGGGRVGFWTSSSYAGDANSAWLETSVAPKSNTALVLLVR